MARLEAVLLAGAAGDAIGGPFEGGPEDPARSIPPPPWAVSDDTRLTFATCRAIARARIIDPAVIAEELVREHRRGVPGVGSSTLKALRDLATGQHWALAGARGESAAGNGAAMRDVATITHHNDEAAAGALAVVLAMQELADDATATREATLRRLVEVLPDTALSDSLASLASLPADAPFDVAARRVGTSGRTAQSIALAVFIGTSPLTVEEAVLAAVRAGGDTDTIAAVAAQLRAGSGEDVPEVWRAHLPLEEVRSLAAELRMAGPIGQARARRPWWKRFV